MNFELKKTKHGETLCPVCGEAMFIEEDGSFTCSTTGCIIKRISVKLVNYNG